MLLAGGYEDIHAHWQFLLACVQLQALPVSSTREDVYLRQICQHDNMDRAVVLQLTDCS